MFTSNPTTLLRHINIFKNLRITISPQKNTSLNVLMLRMTICLPFPCLNLSHFLPIPHILKKAISCPHLEYCSHICGVLHSSLNPI